MRILLIESMEERGMFMRLSTDPLIWRRNAAFGGLFAGAALAFLVTRPLTLLPGGMAVFLAAMAVYAALMAIGWRIGRTLSRQKGHEAADGPSLCPKILDTSVIIDGRVFDIRKAGFLEGDLIVPDFVLDELRHIADSADPLRRTRGRRGLDLLNRMREELKGQLRTLETAEDAAAEVDVKLLRLARDLGGAVLTNDYNLNKAAGVSGVPVLNINELAGTLRAVMLPGEEMTVRVIREGKEPGQGVAYLDDGTMVVIENGRRRVGDTVNAEVTTVLQTNAGRMIFARIKTDENQAV